MSKLTAVSYTVQGVRRTYFMLLPVDTDGKVRVPLALEEELVRQQGGFRGLTYVRG